LIAESKEGEEAELFQMNMKNFVDNELGHDVCILLSNLILSKIAGQTKLSRTREKAIFDLFQEKRGKETI